MPTLDRLGVAALAAATLACIAIVPAFPLLHLDDPGHWGVIGYFLTLPVLFRHRRAGARGAAAERRWLTLFLVAMPVVYLAFWLRYAGTGRGLATELAGAAIYWSIAWLALRRPPWVLAAGIAGHGLWDIAHYQRSFYVPDWYALACFVVDLGVGIYVVGRIGFWRGPARQDAGSTAP